jgi:UDP-N-acetylglucosamine 3-dehydrogenase
MSTNAMSTSKIKIGILSAAHMHAASYAAQIRAQSDRAELVGLWEADQAKGEAQAAAIGATPITDIDVLIKASDAIVICSENIRHKELVERAAAAQKPILCEKPLATNPADAKQMVDICEKAGAPLCTAFPCRFSVVFQELKARVEQGEIGEILGIRGTNQGMCPWGWFVDKNLSGGGAVTDHAVHVTDLLRFLLADEVKTVFCEADNNLLHSDFEDTGLLALNFERGVFATLDASWSRPKSFPTWGNVTMGVIGTEGGIEMDMFAQESILYSDKDNRVSYRGWGSDIDGGLVDAFLSLIETGNGKNIATGIDGLRAVEVVDAAYRSIATNQVANVMRL